jgi:hypothetical protein
MNCTCRHFRSLGHRKCRQFRSASSATQHFRSKTATDHLRCDCASPPKDRAIRASLQRPRAPTVLVACAQPPGAAGKADRVGPARGGSKAEVANRRGLCFVLVVCTREPVDFPAGADSGQTVSTKARFTDEVLLRQAHSRMGTCKRGKVVTISDDFLAGW